MTLLSNEKDISVFLDGLDHPEGVTWGPDGFIYAGGEIGQIYRINIETKDVQELGRTNGFVLGMALDAKNNIYACDATNRSVYKITPEGSISAYSTGTIDNPFGTPNYPAFDIDGNLYVADSGDWEANNGCIYKIDSKGETRVWDTRLAQFPNGLCLGPDGDYLYVAMSLNEPRVARVKIESDGSAGDTETVVELPNTVPDGLAFDSQRNLYIACYRPDRIYRLSSSGNLEILGEDFQGTLMAAPTNVVFCGPNLGRMLSANLGRWHLTEYQVGINGLPLNYPDLG